MLLFLYSIDGLTSFHYWLARRFFHVSNVDPWGECLKYKRFLSLLNFRSMKNLKSDQGGKGAWCVWVDELLQVFLVEMCKIITLLLIWDSKLVSFWEYGFSVLAANTFLTAVHAPMIGLQNSCFRTLSKRGGFPPERIGETLCVSDSSFHDRHFFGSNRRSCLSPSIPPHHLSLDSISRLLDLFSEPTKAFHPFTKNENWLEHH